MLASMVKRFALSNFFRLLCNANWWVVRIYRLDITNFVTSYTIAVHKRSYKFHHLKVKLSLFNLFLPLYEDCSASKRWFFLFYSLQKCFVDFFLKTFCSAMLRFLSTPLFCCLWQTTFFKISNTTPLRATIVFWTHTLNENEVHPLVDMLSRERPVS